MAEKDTKYELMTEAEKEAKGFGMQRLRENFEQMKQKLEESFIPKTKQTDVKFMAAQKSNQNN